MCQKAANVKGNVITLAACSAQLVACQASSNICDSFQTTSSSSSSSSSPTSTTAMAIATLEVGASTADFDFFCEPA